jgi:hemoglobin-like flavoprotein
VVRERAMSDYKKLREDTAFYEAFYDHLFGPHPELRDLFSPDMAQQYEKLHNSILFLFNFNPNDELTPLDPTIETHRDKRLSDQHFDAFRDAFLEALRDAHGFDDYSLDAWRAILDPALDYMRRRVVVDHGPKKAPTRRQRPRPKASAASSKTTAKSPAKKRPSRRASDR